jgi:mono/diheme cytochrome c family protein
VTQVPEYLLERSRARRAALGLGGDAPAGSSPAVSGVSVASEGGGSAGMTATATAVATASSAPAMPSAPPVPEVPLPEYVTDPGPKSGIPYWMMPILLILPLWGVVYIGAFGQNATVQLTGTALGAQVFSSNCAVCHGAQGQGGVGPKLAGGEAKLTFPNEADHITWVTNGSSTKKGQVYGDPNRVGGAHVAATGGMPAFGGQLTAAQITAVVEYERNTL